MSLPTPLGGLSAPQLLRATTGGWPPQAALGRTISIAADGTVHGQTAFPIRAGDAWALALTGTLFRAGVPATGVLYVPGMVPALVAATGLDPVAADLGTGLTTGAPDLTYGLEFRVQGRRTRGMAGWAPGEIRLYLADGASAVVLGVLLYVQPPLDAQASIQRGAGETIALALTGADGTPYDLTGMDLVWSMGPLTLTPGGGLVVEDAAGGRVTLMLRADQTRQLVAGLGPWLLTDTMTGRVVAQDTLQVL
jgi:hypothetical protein